MIQIIPLKNAPEFIEKLGAWLHKEFGGYNPGETLKDRIKKLESRLNTTTIPICLIAIQNGELRGTASLVPCDMKIRKELTPWLASVYVHPPFRRKGLATKLVSEISKIAKNFGHKEVFLFTPDQQKLYERNGWKPYENLDYLGKNVDLMRKEL